MINNKEIWVSIISQNNNMFETVKEEASESHVETRSVNNDGPEKTNIN